MPDTGNRPITDSENLLASDTYSDIGLTTDSGSALTPITPGLTPSQMEDMGWGEIVDSLLAQMGDDDLPDDVVKATEYLLAGWPTHKVARELGVSTKKIKSWLVRYPTMAAILASGRKMLTKWRMGKLEQQFILALGKSEEILRLSLTGGGASDEDGEVQPINSKLVGIVAQHSRYMIDLFAGKKIDLHIHTGDEDPLLKAKRDALDYLVDGLARQRGNEEPIEGTFRMVDETDPGPLLNENGEPRYGELGALVRNEQGETQCHVCGVFYKRLDIHLRTKHKISPEDYEVTFMLAVGEVGDGV